MVVLGGRGGRIVVGGKRWEWEVWEWRRMVSVVCNQLLIVKVPE